MSASTHSSVQVELAVALFQRIINTENRLERWKRELGCQVANLSSEERAVYVKLTTEKEEA